MALISMFHHFFKKQRETTGFLSQGRWFTQQFSPLRHPCGWLGGGTSISWYRHGNGGILWGNDETCWFKLVKHGDFKKISWWIGGFPWLRPAGESLAQRLVDDRSRKNGGDIGGYNWSMMVDDELLGIVKCFFGKPVLNQAVCLGTTDGFERCSRTTYI